MIPNLETFPPEALYNTTVMDMAAALFYSKTLQCLDT